MQYMIVSACVCFITRKKFYFYLKGIQPDSRHMNNFIYLKGEYSRDVNNFKCPVHA